ncbi:MAG: amidase [Aquabacterium sp.]
MITAAPHDLTDLDAHALSQAIHARQVSCRDVMQAYLARIRVLNPLFNAIVNQRPDDTLLAEADACDADLAAGRSRGFLHGMPQAIKDASNAAGLPTTYGSPLLARSVAQEDSLMAGRMRAAGCIIIGKTNIPEFGLGSHSYNRLFGTTLNAWDRSRTAGGSSGGAAVCLAQRMLPLADGSDFMGSLRNPAAWNHVFGLRPSQGRVPRLPAPDVWINQLGTEGPMARNVRDLARLLSIQAGSSPQAPLGIAQGPQSFMPPDNASAQDLRIGWLGDLGGHLATDPGVLEVCEQALRRLEAAGAVVEPIALGFDHDQLWDAWLAWRRMLTAPSVGMVMHLPGARDQVKPEALWEYDQVQQLSGVDFMAASRVRSDWYRHLLKLFATYDALALPAAQVWPFDAAMTWPREIAGRRMDTYNRWMECTIHATFGGVPAISVPAGFDAAGRLPMGLQLIGAPQGDADLLALAAAYEAQAADLLALRPAAP